MTECTLQMWLRKEAAKEAADGVLFATCCSLMGGGVLVLTLAGLGLMGWLGGTLVAGAAEAGSGVGSALPWVCAASSALLGLMALWWVNARLSRSGLEPRWNREARWFGSAAEHRRFPALASVLAYPGQSSAGGLDWLLSGPRFMTMAWAHGQRALRLQRMDLHDAAAVLGALLSRGQRVPLSEVVSWTVLRDPVRTVLDLRELPGVLFLGQPVPALTLTSEYRAACGKLVGPSPGPVLVSDAERGAAAVRALQAALGWEFPKEFATRQGDPSGKATQGSRRVFRVPQRGPSPTYEVEKQRELTAGSSPAKRSQETEVEVKSVWEQHRPRGTGA